MFSTPFETSVMLRVTDPCLCCFYAVVVANVVVANVVAAGVAVVTL